MRGTATPELGSVALGSCPRQRPRAPAPRGLHCALQPPDGRAGAAGRPGGRTRGGQVERLDAAPGARGGARCGLRRGPRPGTTRRPTRWSSSSPRAWATASTRRSWIRAAGRAMPSIRWPSTSGPPRGGSNSRRSGSSRPANSSRRPVTATRWRTRPGGSRSCTSTRPTTGGTASGWRWPSWNTSSARWFRAGCWSS